MPGSGRSPGQGDPQVRKIPWRRAWQPILVFLPRKFQGQRSLVGYSPLGRKELGMTVTEHMAKCYFHED